MQIETLRDVLQWTREFHNHLSTCMTHCADHHENERAKLLLNYLVKHEEKLGHLLEAFEKSESQSVLSTWTIEYLNKQPIIKHRDCSEPFAQLSSTKIMEVIIDYHQQIIELYRHLLSRSEIPKARVLLGNLLFLEEHEAMQMSQAANRLEDL
jgi:uncharacterized protein (DUF305 family)